MSKTYNHNGYTFIHKEDMSHEEWLDTRRDGVGGSDVSVVMGMNPWQSAIRLFYEKLGVVFPKNLDENDSIFWGRMDEDNIRNASQYYDKSDPLKYMPNFYGGNQLHTHADVPFFIIRDDMPWLQANVDGLGWENQIIDQPNLYLTELIKGGKLPEADKVVEIKTIKGRSRDRWAGGIPHGYVLQVLTYMMVCEGLGATTGEIYSRVDGVNLEYHPIEWNNDLMAEIYVKTREFQDRIEKAREAIKGFYGSVDEIFDVCMDFEPEPDGSEDYSKFYSENELLKIEAAKTKIIGTKEVRDAVVRYQELGRVESEASAERKEISNFLKHYLRENKCTVATFEEGGKISFNRRIYISGI